MKYFSPLAGLCAVVMIAVMSGCGGSNTDKVCSNDFEEITAWSNTMTGVAMGNGHSGFYYTYTDSTLPFSATFCRHISELGDHPIKNAKISVWVRPMEDGATANVVLSVERKGEMLVYNSIDTRDKAIRKNEWTKIEGSVAFPANLQGTDAVKAYVWNTTKKRLDADDFEIRFQY